MKKHLLLYFIISFLAISCNKNDDDINNPGKQKADPTANVDEQDFMWNALNLWYFWQKDVPNLGDNRFSSSEEYTAYLSQFSNPESFFFDELLFEEDRFSYLSDDYKDLVNSQQGISKSNGLEFGLVQFSDSDNVFGYVRYIVPNSNAASADIQRGEIFTGVNGQALNLDNYSELLFGNNSDTYTLNMADITSTDITDNDKDVSLTKLEGLVENPVFITKTFTINDSKIGYLMYNGFTRTFNEELNAAFGQLKSEGVTELVLDMRYNPGGSVNSSRLLASMIYGTHTNDLYIKQRWNDKVQPQLSASQLEDYFASTTGTDGSAINSLNLSKVYVLATYSSASASELVMNGLAPYVDVIHIGETTRGKNEFSITLVDIPDNNYVYNSSRENDINSKVQWGLQPLVGRNENADGFSDYTAGLAPDIELKEDLANLGVLGDINEPLLARAIQEITGATGKRDFTVKFPAKSFTSSKMFSPMKDNMYIDKPLSFE